MVNAGLAKDAAQADKAMDRLVRTAGPKRGMMELAVLAVRAGGMQERGARMRQVRLVSTSQSLFSSTLEHPSWFFISISLVGSTEVKCGVQVLSVIAVVVVVVAE